MQVPDKIVAGHFRVAASSEAWGWLHALAITLPKAESLEAATRELNNRVFL